MVTADLPVGGEVVDDASTGIVRVVEASDQVFWRSFADGGEIFMDKSQRTEKYSSADFVAHAGIPTFIDAVHAIAHNKVMVIDGETVLTGSFNFTKAAEDRNAENLLVIHDKAIVEKYQKNWEVHRAHSEGYAGR